MNGRPELDAGTIFQTLVGAATGAFGDHWPEVRTFAEREFKSIAQRIVDIASDVANGAYDVATGRLLLRMQVNVAAQAIAGLTTLTLLMVEDAINRTLEAVNALVNQVVQGLLPL